MGGCFQFKQLCIYFSVHQKAYMLHTKSGTPRPFLFRMKFKVENSISLDQYQGKYFTVDEVLPWGGL